MRALALLSCLSACSSGGGTTDSAIGGREDAALEDAAPATDAEASESGVGGDAEVPAPEGPCETGWTPAQEAGRVGDLLAEASGLGASRLHPGVLWTHTDSSGEPTVYAVDVESGAIRGSLSVPMRNTDFEDLSVAACPGGEGSCVWVADTGDNALERDTLVVHALQEPETLRQDDTPEDRWKFLIDSPGLDFEAIAVAPDGSRFWLFEKVRDEDRLDAGIYAPPEGFEADRPFELVRTGSLISPGLPVRFGRAVTGADLHPSGSRLLLRFYTGTWEWRLGADQDPGDLEDIEPTTVSLGPVSEGQGEAVCYAADGRDVWTLSEDPDGAEGQPLHRYLCLDED